MITSPSQKNVSPIELCRLHEGHCIILSAILRVMWSMEANPLYILGAPTEICIFCK